eukprot:gene4367-8692_t
MFLSTVNFMILLLTVNSALALVTTRTVQNHVIPSLKEVARKNNVKICMSSSDVQNEMNWDPLSAPKLNFNECYYKVLEVSQDADATVIKKAFYKLVLKYHPDNKETEEEKNLCNKQMMVINGAYRILKDPTTRDIYNLKRQQGLFGANAKVKDSSSSTPNPPPSSTSTPKSRTSSSKSSSKSTSSSDAGGAFGGAWKKRFEEEDINFDDDIYNDIFADFFNDFEEVDSYEKRMGRKKTIHNKSILDEIEEYLRKQAAAAARADSYSSYDYSGRGSTSSGKRGENPFSYDGSSSSEDTAESAQLQTLQSREVQLQKEVNSKERQLLNDNRDWGEVTDVMQIKGRLDAIANLKDLKNQLGDVQAEIAAVLWQMKNTNNDNTRQRNYNNNNPSQSSQSRFDYSEFVREARSQPQRQPQTQPQRQQSQSQSASPRRRSAGTVNGGSGGSGSGGTSRDLFEEFTRNQDPESPTTAPQPDEQTWRRAYERRRNPGGGDGPESGSGSEVDLDGDEAVREELRRMDRIRRRR